MLLYFLVWSECSFTGCHHFLLFPATIFSFFLPQFSHFTYHHFLISPATISSFSLPPFSHFTYHHFLISPATIFSFPLPPFHPFPCHHFLIFHAIIFSFFSMPQFFPFPCHLFLISLKLFPPFPCHDFLLVPAIDLKIEGVDCKPDEWWSTKRKGIQPKTTAATYSVCDRAAALGRSRRHLHAAVLRPIPDSVHQCPLCGRQCFSRIGLLSHSNTNIQQ